RVLYYSRPVFLPQYGALVGIPFITFNFFIYWDDHYRGRPFYRDFNRYFQFYDRDRRPGIDHRRDDDRRFDQGGNGYPGNRDNGERVFPGPNGGPGYGNPGPNNNYNGRNDNGDRRTIPGPNGAGPGYGNPGNNNGYNGRNDERRYIPGPNGAGPGY